LGQSHGYAVQMHEALGIQVNGRTIYCPSFMEIGFCEKEFRYGNIR
jgi:hypothetical protein